MLEDWKLLTIPPTNTLFAYFGYSRKFFSHSQLLFTCEHFIIALNVKAHFKRKHLSLNVRVCVKQVCENPKLNYFQLGPCPQPVLNLNSLSHMDAFVIPFLMNGFYHKECQNFDNVAHARQTSYRYFWQWNPKNSASSKNKNDL